MSDMPLILILGTGPFAGRIALDLAATAKVPVRILIAGRNVGRLAWLRTAARARAHMFGRPVEIWSRTVDLAERGATTELLGTVKPAVILQAASDQPGAVIANRGNAWARLIARGGLSATAVLQSHVSLKVAEVAAETTPASHFINACFPDVVNGLIAARGLKVLCGIGNIQILAHALAGSLGTEERKDFKVLAHYQNLAAWRREPAARRGPNARIWIGGAKRPTRFSASARFNSRPSR